MTLPSRRHHKFRGKSTFRPIHATKIETSEKLVVEDQNENFRIRKCVIFYYLDDDTIHILEHRVENSNYLRKYLSSGGNGSKYENNADVKVLVEETKTTVASVILHPSGPLLHREG